MVHLGNVAKISRGYVDPKKSINKINGIPGLTIAVNLKDGGNIIQLGNQVDAKPDEYKEFTPMVLRLSELLHRILLLKNQ